MKSVPNCEGYTGAAVTLRVRVWIEIAYPRRAARYAGVTLRVRVWIEILLVCI